MLYPLSYERSHCSILHSALRRVFGADAVDGRSTLRLCLRDAWVDLEAAAEAIHRTSPT